MPRLEKAIANAAASRPHSRVSVYVVLTLGIAATALATFAVYSVTSGREKRAFDRVTSDFVRSAEQRMERFVNATLQAGAFFSVTPHPTRSQFGQFIQESEFIERYPGDVGIGFVARVSADELDKFVEANRRDGVPDFNVRPAGRRDEYFPIQFLEPDDTENRRAVGYDMSSDPLSLEAMARARDTGRLVATGSLTLVQNRNGSLEPGLRIYAPVYEGFPTSVEARRRTLVGFAYTPIRASDFFGELRAETASDIPFEVEVFDGSEPLPDHLMFDSDPAGDQDLRGQRLQTERLDALAKRTWTFVFTIARGSWITRMAPAATTAFLGLVFTLLLFSIVDGHWRRAENESLGRIRERAFRGFIEAILDTTRALIVVLDAELFVIYFNQHAEEVTGFGRDEMRGTRVPLPFIPPEQRAQIMESISLLTTDRGGEWHEGEIVTKDGDRRTIAWSNAVTRDAAGDTLFIISAGIDVTQIRASEAERAQLLAQSQKDIEDLRVERELREKFVATLTHDLRNPLGAARLSAESLRRRDPDSTRLARIVSNIDRADRMIQDLLDSHRARAGKAPPLRIEAFDLVAHVKEALDDLAAMLGPRFELHAPETLPGYWSATGLRRLVENLATNAVKYGDPDAAVVVTIARSGDRVLLSVHNEGNPIPPEEQAQLFKDFVRSPSAEASDRQGWGLGLTVIQGVTAAHKGSVRVTSAPGQGTTFTVELPVDAREGSNTGERA